MNWTNGYWVAGSLALCSACASAPPNDRLESSAAAIRAAEEVGATKVPQAALHLELAREQQAHAKQALTQGDKQEAGSLLMRSQADAELAVALAREDRTRLEALQAVQKNESVQQADSGSVR